MGAVGNVNGDSLALWCCALKNVENHPVFQDYGFGTRVQWIVCQPALLVRSEFRPPIMHHGPLLSSFGVFWSVIRGVRLGGGGVMGKNLGVLLRSRFLYGVLL